MDAGHRPIAHASRAERTSVAAAFIQNAPGVAELIAVLPNCLGNVAVGIGMLLVQPIRHEAYEVALLICVHLCGPMILEFPFSGCDTSIPSERLQLLFRLA